MSAILLLISQLKRFPINRKQGIVRLTREGTLHEEQRPFSYKKNKRDYLKAMSVRYYSIEHAYESIFEIHLLFVLIL